ncbi:hypothetical protein ABIE61_003605 [Marinobacterium sp. MBR-111]|jgi:hypothetical protein|uniref:hypothetical protein n=1 Tax=Marinobacterium sp. MBR-111 TaxID=3156463 RepID=UPI0033972948
MRKSMMVLVVAGTLAVSGCSAPRLQDGYQPGDLTGMAVDETEEFMEMQDRYCSTSDPVARAILLMLIRSAVPTYPADGLCTNVLDILEARQ